LFLLCCWLANHPTAALGAFVTRVEGLHVTRLYTHAHAICYGSGQRAHVVLSQGGGSCHAVVNISGIKPHTPVVIAGKAVGVLHIK
jgi:hypothetical protein